ncbi:MAG: hypothetical protein KDJ47_06190 [Hyphomicrobiaceae bacterium]|nr:hypothetical protein [Hyphomicrobiaceae bacterium]
MENFRTNTDAAGPQDHSASDVGGWEIALELPWCVIRICVPGQPSRASRADDDRARHARARTDRGQRPRRSDGFATAYTPSWRRRYAEGDTG